MYRRSASTSKSPESSKSSIASTAAIACGDIGDTARADTDFFRGDTGSDRDAFRGGTDIGDTDFLRGDTDFFRGDTEFCLGDVGLLVLVLVGLETWIARVAIAEADADGDRLSPERSASISASTEASS